MSTQINVIVLMITADDDTTSSPFTAPAAAIQTSSGLVTTARGLRL